jgi:AhpD family alkylhydroperoxidase
MAHDGHGGEVLAALGPMHRQLRREIPDVYAGFRELHGAALRDGALDAKTKELIALAIAVVEGCDGCMASHAQAAARAGATRAEAADAIGVAFLMRGGPASINGPRAFAMFCEFADPNEEGVPHVA